MSSYNQPLQIENAGVASAPFGSFSGYGKYMGGTTSKTMGGKKMRKSKSHKMSYGGFKAVHPTSGGSKKHHKMHKKMHKKTRKSKGKKMFFGLF